MLRIGLLLAIIYMFAVNVSAQEAKTRDELVQEDRANFESLDAWVYNDVARGFDTASKTGKPLLIVFRCIPCAACAQLDESIVERDPRVRDLLDQYVCVRVVYANGLDLGLFQFDYDQSFAAFIMNGDKTIYGRYGTRSHQTRSEDDVSLEGFIAALEAGLAIHADYPRNKALLAGKQGRSEPGYSTPEQFPQLAKYTSRPDYEGRVAASCIHCHQVGESLHAVWRDKGEPMPTDVLFPYPHPKILGLIMDPEARATVSRVEPTSVAEQSGFQAGDEIVTVDDQSIVSTADIQWALHHADDPGQLAVSIRRRGETLQLKLPLAHGWRSRGDISWRATSWALRRMTTGGMLLEDAGPELRAANQIDDDSLALVARHVGEYGEHAHAKRQGFLKDDLIVSIAGQSHRMRESDLFALMVNRPVGEEVPVTILRGRDRRQMSLVMQK
jgi:thioredoxin-related protein